jgi:hypothetical protein
MKVQKATIQRALLDLESTLEAYLDAWRKEFGMGEARCGLRPEGPSPRAASHDALVTQRVMPDRR